MKGVDLAGEVCTVFESVSQCLTGDPVKWENTALVRLIIVIDYYTDYIIYIIYIYMYIYVYIYILYYIYIYIIIYYIIRLIIATN